MSPGIFLDLPELSGKQLQFLKEIVPGLVRVAVLWDRKNRGAATTANEEAARMVDIRLNALASGARRDQAGGGRARSRARPGARRAHVPTVVEHSRADREMTQKYRLPTISRVPLICRRRRPDGLWPEPTRDVSAALPAMSDKILRGAKAGELPVGAPEQVRAGDHLKTAKALGLTIRRSLLGRADEVIQ